MICIYSLFIFLSILDFKATSFGSSHFSDFGTRRGGGHGCQHTNSIEFFQLDAHVPENWLNIIQIIHSLASVTSGLKPSKTRKRVAVFPAQKMSPGGDNDLSNGPVANRLLDLLATFFFCGEKPLLKLGLLHLWRIIINIH